MKNKSKRLRSRSSFKRNQLRSRHFQPQEKAVPVDGAHYLPEEAAPLLGTTKGVLAVARCTKRGAFASLEFIKSGAKILYAGSAIKRFLESHTVKAA
jgi:hypothetical protein